MTTPPSKPTPGWYPDQQDPSRNLWWDGEEWSAVRPFGAPKRKSVVGATALVLGALVALVMGIGSIADGLSDGPNAADITEGDFHAAVRRGDDCRALHGVRDRAIATSPETSERIEQRLGEVGCASPQGDRNSEGLSPPRREAPPGVIARDPNNDRMSESVFLSLIRDNVPGASSRSDQDLIAGARQLCGSLADIEDQDDLAVVADALGFDIREFAYVVTASVSRYCPQHSRLVQ